MDSSLIRAFLWRDVIRLGFSPSGDKNKKSWLRQYGRSLQTFWETESDPPLPKSKNGTLSTTIDCMVSVNISFEYAIEPTNKFTVRIMSPLQQLLWIHDYDDAFFSFPHHDERILASFNRSDAIKMFKKADLEAVIESLIAHPTPHQHIESPIDRHEIRVGGGIINPYLYLYHLRYQFCPNQPLRDAEFRRIVNLFDLAIKDNNPVTANDLMSQPR